MIKFNFLWLLLQFGESASILHANRYRNCCINLKSRYIATSRTIDVLKSILFLVFFYLYFINLFRDSFIYLYHQVIYLLLFTFPLILRRFCTEHRDACDRPCAMWPLHWNHLLSMPDLYHWVCFERHTWCIGYVLLLLFLSVLCY